MKNIIFIVAISLAYSLNYGQNKEIEKKQIQIIEPWARAAKAGMNTAAYMIIKNSSDLADTLLSVESKVAEINEIHEIFSVGQKMGMRKIQFLVIPPKSQVELKPRSTHIMLINLNENIDSRENIELTLNFKRNGSIKLEIPIRKMR